MNESIPPGDWVTVSEACEIVPDVTRRRIQALGKSGRVKCVTVLGRLLLDRAALLAWKATRAPGRPAKPKGDPPAEKKPKGRKK